MKDHIKIVDWTGRILFEGHHKSKEVDRVLEANRCVECDGKIQEMDYNCNNCDGTSYEGEFEVFWIDENDDRNVYEFINY
jgi:hypothetical protein